ncbi:hypothetical protein QA648_11355 [Rhizobium sp. CB3171]|uniref:hypothetical protein n=1 Tax=Rhizobium sp. CB3171 TaxID=3039157 RepID=UPI0024B1739F|nr:hypothetical protein [Rhizobium sp. CB3171]WFU00764.1 hypothetical protein QA648_11355 [Rhizobium sp. CB3171]
MTDKGPDGFMMIGLHRLASQKGDGLVPELYELLMRRAEEQRQAPNVTAFPFWQARLPGEAPDAPLGISARDGTNVIAFTQQPGKTAERRKKV